LRNGLECRQRYCGGSRGRIAGGHAICTGQLEQFNPPSGTAVRSVGPQFVPEQDDGIELIDELAGNCCVGLRCEPRRVQSNSDFGTPSFPDPLPELR
jgi:hypothetical protein